MSILISIDDTYLVRFPKDFPLSVLALAVNRHGYRIKHVMPKDLRTRSHWEFVPTEAIRPRRCRNLIWGRRRDEHSKSPITP